MTWLERDREAPAAWPGDLPVRNRYTFGIAGERFFRALKDEGRILGSRCPRCDVVYVPARAFCERCLHGLEEWIDVGSRGEVNTFTVLHADPDGSYRDTAEVIAFVRLGDGGLVHRLGEIAPEEVTIGMSVEAVLKPQAERTGSILDIDYFRPVKT
jgi:uncharacterized OB-fold protein